MVSGEGGFALTRRLPRNRNGSAARRRLEFETILHHVRRDKAAFIRRLASRLRATENGCLLYEATKVDGYPTITFRYAGRHIVMRVHRVFVILKHCAPIPLGYETAHTPDCTSRACVRHIELQHFSENAATNNGGARNLPF